MSKPRQNACKCRATIGAQRVRGGSFIGRPCQAAAMWAPCAARRDKRAEQAVFLFFISARACA